MVLATSKFWKLLVLAARYSICWTILFNLGTIWVTGLGNSFFLYGKGLISQDSILLASSLITWPFLIEDSERHTNREIHSIHSLLVSPLIRWVPDHLLLKLLNHIFHIRPGSCFGFAKGDIGVFLLFPRSYPQRKGVSAASYLFF